MEYNDIRNNRWIFKKHTREMNLLIEVALYLKGNSATISKQEKEKMYDIFSQLSFYNPRKSKRFKPLDAVTHKIQSLSFFMFGYSGKINSVPKFIFSPLGNLFLKHLNNELFLTKIFMTMLIGMQFPHPTIKKSTEFNIFPFRLIFTLLLDDRLEGKIYHFEIVRYIMFMSNIDLVKYEQLVEDILQSRKISDTKKLNFLKQHEYEFTKSVYEWQYYIAPLLEDIGIINIDNGNEVVEIHHPKKPNSKTETKRKANNGFIQLAPTIINLLKTLLSSYSVWEKPLLLNDTTKFSNDIVKEIYSFYPDELLFDIGEKTNSIENQLLSLPKKIEQYSLNPNNKTSDKFENILVDAFNMFIDVEAEKISGPGQTDIECIYLTLHEKFAVEAKSTANKLNSINAGRLRHHQDIIGAKYTIVVTPRYVPSVQYDIQHNNIVIIKANTLTEFLYNNIISHNRDITYQEIRDLIIQNLGTDVSSLISDLTLSTFG